MMDSTTLSNLIRTTFQVTFMLCLLSNFNNQIVWQKKQSDNHRPDDTASVSWLRRILSSQTGTKVLSSNSDYLSSLWIEKSFVGCGSTLLPHLVSTIQAVVATLTIALVWSLVRISWPWHLTQVRVVARRQPDHRHWFGVNSKESRSLYSPLFSNLSPGTCVRYPLLSRTTPQIPPPTFRIQESNFEL